MNKLKAKVDFTDYPDAELSPIALTIHAKMTEKAEIFPDPPVTMKLLGTNVATCVQKLSEKLSRATADILAFAVVREQV